MVGHWSDPQALNLCSEYIQRGGDETSTKKYSDDCEGVLEDLIVCVCKKE